MNTNPSIDAYFLITTNFVETWPIGTNLLFIDPQFLGNASSPENTKYEFVESDSLDEHQKVEKYNLSTSISESILPDVAKYLNHLHKTNHGIAFWTFCANFWLTNFVDILFQRWEMVDAALLTQRSIAYHIFPVDEDLICPNTTRDLIKLSQSAAWNHQVFASILEERNIATLNFPNSVINWSAESLLDQQRAAHRSTKSRVHRFLQKRIARFSRSVFSATYLPSKSEWRLALKHRSLPIRWFEPQLDFQKIDIKLRESIKLTNGGSSQFESFLRKMIPLHLPKSLVENFDDIISQTRRMNLPATPRVIFTSNLHLSSDSFMIWAAKCQEAGTSLIIGQHGGLFGQANPPTRDEFQELSIADKYISWGWDDGAKQLVRGPTLINLGASRLQRSNTPTDLLLVTDGIYKYSRRPWSIISSNATYIANLLSLVRCLPAPIQKSTLVRLYKGHEQFDSKQVTRWTEFMEQIRVDNGEQPIQNLRKNAKLIICTTLGTSEVEQFYSKIPTVIFLDLKIVHLRQSMIPVFKLLEQAGVVHYSVESLVNHITSVWDDVDSWWNMPKTQEAVSNFQSKFAQQIPDGLRFIVNEIATDD